MILPTENWLSLTFSCNLVFVVLSSWILILLWYQWLQCYIFDGCQFVQLIISWFFFQLGIMFVSKMFNPLRFWWRGLNNFSHNLYFIFLSRSFLVYLTGIILACKKPWYQTIYQSKLPTERVIFNLFVFEMESAHNAVILDLLIETLVTSLSGNRLIISHAL